ncbi:MAG: hypothetical protein RL077_1584 [Verrucomicrobiota bacterium]|jgi:hypothetical protein
MAARTRRFRRRAKARPAVCRRLSPARRRRERTGLLDGAHPPRSPHDQSPFYADADPADSSAGDLPADAPESA